jgi:tetratricopeptide (TPR) repeat protein
MAGVRSAVWNNTYTLFSNAVSRQPDAAYAHYGFAQALREQWFLYSRIPNADPRRVKLLRDKWHLHLHLAAECPDAARIPDYIQLLAQLGEIEAERGDFAAAERYFRRALKRGPQTLPSSVSQGEALRGLAMIRYREGKPVEALAELDRAIAVFPSDGARIERAALTLELARAHRAVGQDVTALLLRARTDLEQALKNPQAEKDARPHMETLQRLEAP